jgi:hypothetical protein
MDPRLEAILNEEDNTQTQQNTQPEDTRENTKPENTQVDDEDDDSQPENKSKVETQESDDPDMKWDDDEAPDTHPEDNDKAPDEQDDDDLKKLEERNKWMKHRLTPALERAKKAEEEAVKLKAELDALRGGKPAEAPQRPVDQPQDLNAFIETVPEDISLNQKIKELQAKADSMTEGDYIDAKLEILSDLKITKREIARQITDHQQAQAREIQQVEAKIENDWKSAVLSKKEDYPEIDKALNRVIKNAENIHTEIRRALILDGDKINPLTGDLVAIIGNDKKAMSYLIAESKLAEKTKRFPVKAIEYIGRLKARIEAERSTKGSPEAPDIDETMSRAPRKAGLPREVRQNAHNDGSPKDMLKWAEEAHKKGERPW